MRALKYLLHEITLRNKAPSENTSAEALFLTGISRET
jgi:hypothetical protein